MWLIVVILFVFVLFPFATGMIRVARAGYQLNRISHILQETSAQVWLCDYFAFMIGNEFHLILDEENARQMLSERIEQNFLLSGLEDARLESIYFNSAERFSQSDNRVWNIPLIEFHTVYTDHELREVPVRYSYEMAPATVWHMDDNSHD